MPSRSVRIVALAGLALGCSPSVGPDGGPEPAIDSGRADVGVPDRDGSIDPGPSGPLLIGLHWWEGEIGLIDMRATPLDGVGEPVVQRISETFRQGEPAVLAPDLPDLERAWQVTVSVRFRAGDDRAFAGRCYDFSDAPTIRDEVGLTMFGDVGPPDQDEDGFVSDADTRCHEPDGLGNVRACNDGDAWRCPAGRLVDCDDEDREVFPGAEVTCGDGVDDDCDGDVDEACEG